MVGCEPAPNAPSGESMTMSIMPSGGGGASDGPDDDAAGDRRVPRVAQPGARRRRRAPAPRASPGGRRRPPPRGWRARPGRPWCRRAPAPAASSGTGRQWTPCGTSGSSPSRTVSRASARIVSASRRTGRSLWQRERAVRRADGEAVAHEPRLHARAAGRLECRWRLAVGQRGDDPSARPAVGVLEARGRARGAAARRGGPPRRSRRSRGRRRSPAAGAGRSSRRAPSSPG